MTRDSQGTHRTLGEFIRAHREAVGISQRQLGTKSGIHHSFIARLESGENVARTPEQLQRLADALAVDVTELLRFVGVTPELPEPRAYFRRKLGVNAATADVLARLVEEYQAKEQVNRKGGRNEASND